MEFFKLHFEGGFQSTAYYDSQNQLKFEPPVYEQRYATALRVLSFWEGSFKKIIDFGCAELKFIHMLKQIPEIEHIIGVDIDKTILELNSSRINPLLCDYIKRRETPFKIELYEGSIDSPNDILKNADVIFAIELIEHLYPDVLENVPFNIFGFIQPKLAIFTTPNCEFNVLFDLNFPNGMRHLDHKFEWTRTQFRNWCQNICKRFPKYVVSVFGVGNGPPVKKGIGKVSQMAVFIRKDMVNMEIPMEIEFSKIDLKEIEIISSATKEYNLVHSVEYPIFEDKRTLDEKILDEANYHINRFRNQNHYIKLYNNAEKTVIPLDEIFFYTKQYSDSIDKLKEILKNNNYSVESDNIIVDVEENFESGDDVDELLYGPGTHYSDEEEKYFFEDINGDNKGDKGDLHQESIPDDVSECWD
ncbi:small RNA 2'-O-methyltransferase [Condylostylus longicornis]|uniref:small RNA 2'-O-methyltransferase n=1 Tax=Condylostylus longicornis TaxID=2530218 RepID=UPI00244E3A4D|nr:small RNA 2'-O-methyltransferase [Condylostylus longicornis]